MSCGSFGGTHAMPFNFAGKEEAKTMPMTTEERAKLSGLVQRLEAELAKVPELRNYHDWAIVNRATAGIVERFEKEARATYRDAGNEHRFRMAGIASSSTSSQLGALQNWVANVKKRIAKDMAA